MTINLPCFSGVQNLVLMGSPALHQNYSNGSLVGYQIFKKSAEMVQESGRNPTTTDAMTRQPNTFAAAFSGVAVLLAPAIAVVTIVTSLVPARADEAARQIDQSYCFTANSVDRWKGCR